MSRKPQNNHTDALKFVHITDTHLLDQAEETFHSLNTKKSLETVLSHSQTRYPDIDFLLFTGDISQTGSEESYTLFKSVVQEYDLPIYCVPGNHDTPKLLQHIIPNCPDSSINIIQLGNFSLVLLNSWVENKHHGMVTQRCLQQLDDHLKNSEDQFNIIAIHHPPVSINSTWLDQIGLQNQTDFLQVINQYPKNKLLLFGHVHQEIDQQLDDLRLLATPSTCHQFKANSENMHCTDKAPAYRYIKLCTSNNIDTKVHYVELLKNDNTSPKAIR
jgi:Icc protein